MVWYGIFARVYDDVCGGWDVCKVVGVGVGLKGWRYVYG